MKKGIRAVRGPNMGPGRVRCILLLAGLLSAGTLFAEKPLADPPPPMAVPLKATVYAGESIRIPLKALGRSARTARFLVRSRPALGTLGEIEPGVEGGAVITYTHKKSSGTGADQFTYAAQAVDSPVSAPAKVTIEIIERPPVFDAPKTLDFGTVLTGIEEARTVVLSNFGGGTLTGFAKADGGWEIRGNGAYRLPPGVSERIELVFKAAEPRAYAGVLRFSHDPGAASYLAAVARDPFVLSPSALEFDRRGAPSALRRTVSIVNQTAEDMDLRVQGGGELGIPDRILVPGGSEAAIPASAERVPPAGIEGRIVFAGAGIERTIPYRVFPLPGKLETHPQGGLDFGSFQPDRPPTRSLTLKNTGGLPLSIDIELPPRIGMDGARRLTLQPGAMETVSLFPEGGRAGEWEEALALRAGESLFSIPVRGVTLEAGQTPAPSFSMRGADPAAQPAFPAPHAPTIPGLVEPNPSFSQIELTEIGPDFLRFTFEDPTQGAYGHVLEEREVGVGADGLPAISWHALPGASVRELGQGKNEALLRGMNPGFALRTRITSVDVTGKPLAHSAMFYLALPPRPGAAIPWQWLWLLPAAALAVFLHKRWKAQKQAGLREDLERIRDLEK